MTHGTRTAHGWKQLRIIFMMRMARLWDSSSCMPVYTQHQLFDMIYDMKDYINVRPKADEKPA